MKIRLKPRVLRQVLRVASEVKMEKTRNILNKILSFFAGTSLIVMVVLTCWQVFTRYILSKPSTWSEELVAYLFAWSSLFASALVTGERGHMSIPVLIERMGAKTQKFFLIFAELIALFISLGILVFGGVQIMLLAYGQKTSSLSVQVGFFYIALPVCGVLSSIYIVLNIIDIAKGRMGLITDEENEIITNAEEMTNLVNSDNNLDLVHKTVETNEASQLTDKKLVQNTHSKKNTKMKKGGRA